jgi:hypothetical protein
MAPFLLDTQQQKKNEKNTAKQKRGKSCINQKNSKKPKTKKIARCSLPDEAARNWERKRRKIAWNGERKKLLHDKMFPIQGVALTVAQHGSGFFLFYFIAMKLDAVV